MAVTIPVLAFVPDIPPAPPPLPSFQENPLFHLVSAAVCLFVVWRLVWPRPWSLGARVATALALALVAEHQLITRNFFPHLEAIQKYIYLVRNPITSGNAHWQNLLCDVDLKGGLSRGNPQ